MSKFLSLILMVAALLCFDSILAYSFMGGVSVHQSRTIGGKNPLKQRGYRKGNPQTKIFHNSTCRYYKSKHSTILFKSAQEAILSGFRPCSKCGG